MGNEWLKNLKPGNKVIVRGFGYDDMEVVERITPTGRIVVKHTTYDPNGIERGSYGLRRRLYEATPEAVEQIRRDGIIHAAVKHMRNTPNITYDQAVQILAVLDKQEPQNEG